MASMECKTFRDRLDSWIDGEKSADARAHLAECSACRSLAEDLTAIASAARITAESDPEPPAYLWNSIRARLDDEGIIRQPRLVRPECDAFIDQLDLWLEGARPAEAQSHVARCPDCQRWAEDFAAITIAARATDEYEPEPPAYLWNSIRAQLENEGIIRQPRLVRPQCDAFIDQLDLWLEGARPAEAQSHVAACPDCRLLAGDFAAITIAARATAEHEPEPPAYLWNSIRAQLESEGIIRQPRPSVIPAPAKPRRGWFGLPRTAMAGAFAAVLAVVGLFARGPLTQRINDYRWMQGTQTSTALLTAQLNTVEHATVASLRSDPLVEASLHKNLAIVDNYIALCEKSVRENPQSEMARDFLYDAYQQKADLLAQMNEQGD
ncbi:MAG TPA: anti-sigma factor [Candidatus Acidoferrum sp.]|nr:anti-sigma factor [Candidatus Acidoferrum sp.]